MARPTIGDKPVRIRKSPTVPSERVKKAPSKKAILAYQPLVEACVALVLSNVERDANCNIIGKKAVHVQFSLPTDKPSWMPSGQWTNKGDYFIMSLNAELMLVYLYERRYTEYYPSMLYKTRDVGILNEDLLKEYDFDGFL